MGGSKWTVSAFRLYTTFVDWEWAGAAPYQMLCSPPRWLLFKPPIDWESTQQSKLIERYMACFQVFLRVLQEEEERNREYVQTSERMSSLMRSAMNDGKF